MRAKLEAAAKAGRLGIETYLFNGRSSDVVRALAQDRLFGTRIHAARSREAARSCARAGRGRDRRRCRCGTGDAAPRCCPAASPLPRGIPPRRHGAGVLDRTAGRVARGVSQYAADDVRRIAGHHSRDIQAVLGYNYGGSVVHRDDLVLP